MKNLSGTHSQTLPFENRNYLFMSVPSSSKAWISSLFIFSASFTGFNLHQSIQGSHWMTTSISQCVFPFIIFYNHTRVIPHDMMKNWSLRKHAKQVNVPQHRMFEYSASSICQVLPGPHSLQLEWGEPVRRLRSWMFVPCCTGKSKNSVFLNPTKLKVVVHDL